MTYTRTILAWVSREYCFLLANIISYADLFEFKYSNIFEKEKQPIQILFEW